MKKTCKKLITLLLVFVMLMSSSAIQAFAASKDLTLQGADDPGAKVKLTGGVNFSDIIVGEKLIVNTSLWLRTSQSTTSDLNKIVLLDPGDVVTVEAKYSNTGFIKVNYNSSYSSIHGYCYAGNGWFRRYQNLPTYHSYPDNYWANVTVNAANVRTQALLDPSTISGNCVYYGYVVQALGYTDNGFVKIRYYIGNTSNTREGYVASSLLNVYKGNWKKYPTNEKFSTIYGYTATANDVINVHRDLKFWGSDTHIAATLATHTKFTILQQSKSWYKVKYKQGGSTKTGYILRSQATKIDALKKNVSLSAKTLELDLGGETPVTKATLKVKDTSAPFALSKKLTWKSSKKSVATVTSKGVVTAKKPGKATISCKVKVGKRSVTLKCSVVVKKTEIATP